MTFIDTVMDEMRNLRKEIKETKEKLSQEIDQKYRQQGRAEVAEQKMRQAEQKVLELEAVLQSLVDWDKANPPGRIYPIGPNDVEKQLDRICKNAADALKSKQTEEKK